MPYRYLCNESIEIKSILTDLFTNYHLSGPLLLCMPHKWSLREQQEYN